MIFLSHASSPSFQLWACSQVREGSCFSLTCLLPLGCHGNTLETRCGVLHFLANVHTEQSVLDCGSARQPRARGLAQVLVFLNGVCAPATLPSQPIKGLAPTFSRCPNGPSCLCFPRQQRCVLMVPALKGGFQVRALAGLGHHAVWDFVVLTPMAFQSPDTPHGDQREVSP